MAAPETQCVFGHPAECPVKSTLTELPAPVNATDPLVPDDRVTCGGTASANAPEVARTSSARHATVTKAILFMVNPFLFLYEPSSGMPDRSFGFSFCSAFGLIRLDSRSRAYGTRLWLVTIEQVTRQSLPN